MGASTENVYNQKLVQHASASTRHCGNCVDTSWNEECQQSNPNS